MTLDGYTPESFGLNMYLDHSNPFNPSISNKSVKVPYVDGEYYFKTEKGSKAITIKCDCIEEDDTTRQQMIYSFIAFLHDGFGNPRDIKIIFDYSPDRYIMARLNSQVTPERLMAMTNFGLSFTAYDPYSYSAAEADEITWGSDILTFESSYLLGSEGSPGEVKMTGDTIITECVYGLAVKPIIEVSGTALGLIIANGDYSIRFDGFINSEWEIDCNKYIVKKNGENAFSKVELGEFYLLPGANNVHISGLSLDITINMKYRDKYLS